MELTLTEIDKYRLQSLRIGRLVELLPPMSGLLMSMREQTLCIELPYGLQRIAAIAVGTNQIELYAEERLLCRLSSVESINSTPTITMSAVLERETTTAAAPQVASWKIITSNTGESEADIKKRCHDLGINFHWIGESGDWGVLMQDAQTLASRYYFDLGNAIARTLGGDNEMQLPPQVAAVPPEPAKEKRRSPKPPINFVAEFKPTKNPKVTVERYLGAIAPEKGDQVEILFDIITDAGTARRHLNKITANMSADLKDSTTRAKLQSSFTNLYERMTASKQAPPAVVPDAADTSESD